ncbi:prenyltransferase [Jonesia quinghaiensis]|uniref:prenyltransferase n=1 Tax=Jonesia quinghaiensis TaxID=262806 RepID=UPI0003F73397|nr:prenyltransferase [Jonesia quinghaiensis]
MKQLVATSRPFSWINTAYPFAAAYLLTGGNDWVFFSILTLFFLIPYNLAMYGINDVFDYESDLRNPRKTGMEGIVLDRSMHRATLIATVITCTPFVIYTLAVTSWAARAVFLTSCFAVVAYSLAGLRFKERPFIDSITSSYHFVSPALFGAVVTGAPLGGVTGWVLASFFAWGMASHAFGAIQDVQADREGGIGSIATVVGAQFTARFTVVLYLLSAVLLLVSGSAAVQVCAVVPLLYVASTIMYWNVDDAHATDTRRGWRRFMWLNLFAGFYITQVILISTFILD